MSLQFSLPYILYLQGSSMPPPCVTVDSEGESDTSLELSSEESNSDTETN